MNKTTKMLAFFAAGAVTGAVLGILFAPGKGSETRKKFKGHGKKIKDGIQDKLRMGKEKFNDLKEDIERTVNEKVKDLV